jgi:hypothetical protein
MTLFGSMTSFSLERESLHQQALRGSQDKEIKWDLQMRHTNI